MRVIGMVVFAALVLVGRMGTAADKKSAHDDAQKLEGTWNIVSVEPIGFAGPDVTPEMLKKMKLVIKGDKLTFMMGQTNDIATFKIDLAQKPRAIDIMPGPNELLKGIYELDGDNLKLCFPDPKEKAPRPSKFASDSKTVLMVFKRQK